MRKIFLWLVLLLPACATPRTTINDNNDEVLNAHTKPFKVFGIGYWTKDTMVLTLTDANNEYLTIKTQYDDNLKVGSIYNPQ